MVSSLKKGRVGRKSIPVDLEALRNIPLKERMTIEDVCAKPFLTEANKKFRLKWCVDMIKRGLDGDPRFKDIFDFVFMDEKWFYLSQKSEKYYLLPEEDEPHRTCKNNNYIPRIMFLCVCARPRFRNGECVFDGKNWLFSTCHL